MQESSTWTKSIQQFRFLQFTILDSRFPIPGNQFLNGFPVVNVC
jgi:hypothetical protein